MMRPIVTTTLLGRALLRRLTRAIRAGAPSPPRLISEMLLADTLPRAA